MSDLLVRATLAAVRQTYLGTGRREGEDGEKRQSECRTVETRKAGHRERPWQEDGILFRRRENRDRFHLNRFPGGDARVMERGRGGFMGQSFELVGQGCLGYLLKLKHAEKRTLASLVGQVCPTYWEPVHPPGRLVFVRATLAQTSGRTRVCFSCRTSMSDLLVRATLVAHMQHYSKLTYCSP